MIVPLTKNNVAVLTPAQWHLIENHLNADYKIRGDFLLQTAMRVTECYYVSRHPETFKEDHGAIFLPKVEGEEKFGKTRAKQKERLKGNCLICFRPDISSGPFSNFLVSSLRDIWFILSERRGPRWFLKITDR